MATSPTLVPRLLLLRSLSTALLLDSSARVVLDSSVTTSVVNSADSELALAVMAAMAFRHQLLFNLTLNLKELLASSKLLEFRESLEFRELDKPSVLNPLRVLWVLWLPAASLVLVDLSALKVLKVLKVFVDQ